jgi:hypothetical protein
MGVVDQDWQDSATVLANCGQNRRRAVRRYEEFVREGTSQGSRPELVRGGLMRSLGGWVQGLFIDQPALIEKILTHLGLWPARAQGPPEAAAA